MAEETPTREDTVTANLTAIKAKYGDEAWPQIQVQLLTDINLSLALLVDAGSSNAE